MALLNTADAIYVGSTTADRVYLGTVQVWPPAVPAWTRSAMAVGLWPIVINPGASREANAGGIMVNV